MQTLCEDRPTSQRAWQGHLAFLVGTRALPPAPSLVSQPPPCGSGRHQPDVAFRSGAVGARRGALRTSPCSRQGCSWRARCGGRREAAQGDSTRKTPGRRQISAACRPVPRSTRKQERRERLTSQAALPKCQTQPPCDERGVGLVAACDVRARTFSKKTPLIKPNRYLQNDQQRLLFKELRKC